MKCITCAHLDIAKHPAHAKADMGLCTEQNRELRAQGLGGVTFTSIMKERECDRYQEAAPVVVQGRRQWWKEIRGAE